MPSPVTSYQAPCPRCGNPCDWLARNSRLGVTYEIRCPCGPANRTLDS